MSSVNVEVKNPLCAPWTDDQIKHQLAAEIHTYGKYGHVEVLQQKRIIAHMVVPPHEPTCSHSNNPLEVIFSSWDWEMVLLETDGVAPLALLSSMGLGVWRGCNFL
ncbi:hypothetical protein AAG906_020694 [Vitis piasezkii]